ncbi:MAG: hypothetical protein C0594_17415 [Marinilabiliales bacterium]|nr:MAG: hypothetical protein C0594_17415 [Marinilabiliales bacterium]
MTLKIETMIKKLLILIIISQWAFLSYAQQNNKMNDTKLFQKEVSYPYKASENREKVILENMNKLEKGMTKKEVIELMSAPDEINLTYSSIKSKSKDNVIGSSLVYILKRKAESGSADQKGEKLIRIHFDNSEKLLWSTSTNINEFKAIEKE